MVKTVHFNGKTPERKIDNQFKDKMAEPNLHCILFDIIKTDTFTSMKARSVKVPKIHG